MSSGTPSETYQDDFTPENVASDYSKSKMSLHDRKQAQLIVDVLKENGKICDGKKLPTLLDVGCGCGVATSLLAEYFDSAIGLDTSPNQIRIAEGMEHPRHIQFKIGSAEKLPVADESIDVITVILALHFIEIGSFVEECRRVLKPHGVAIFYTDMLTAMTSSENEALPMIVDEIMEMNKACLVIANMTSHPELHILNEFQTHYDAIDWPGKRKLKRKTEISANLAEMRDYHLSVPFYARLGKPPENPLIQVFKDVQKIWGLEKVAADDVKVRATFSATLIVLEKKSGP